MSGPGQVLFAFVRHWSRRSLAGSDVAEQGRLVVVTEAVHSLGRRRVPATVNAVADEIGIDQSGASRLVTSATAAGYLTMAASETDRRVRQATVTATGAEMLGQAHHWQEQVFDRLTRSWSDDQRRNFQRAMTDLMNRSYGLDV